MSAASAAAHHTGHLANAASASPLVEGLERFGLIVRGIIYLLPGVLALQLGLGNHGAAMSQTGAIEMIGHQPFGRAMLIGVAAGLAGYSLWGVVRAVFDPLQKGHDPSGLLKRFGYGMSALAYAGLFIATIRYLSGATAHVAKPRDWSAELLSHPMGPWLLGIVGLCWIAGGGISEIARGWRGSFEKDLDLSRARPNERRWALRLGRIGIVARGIVFTIIGILLVTAALHARAHADQGLDGALLALARQPFGRSLLAGAGLGLIAFGAYSLMCSRWQRLHVARPAPA